MWENVKVECSDRAWDAVLYDDVRWVGLEEVEGGYGDVCMYVQKKR